MSPPLRFFLVTIAVALAWMPAASTSHAQQAPSPPPTTRPVRVGTYDPRAIAVAYVHSELNRNQMQAKMKEMSQAKAAGNKSRIKELEQWGQSQQRLRHMQAFAAAPVEDILLQIRDELEALARAKQLDVLARKTDWQAPGVESIDVTDDLAGLFNPPEKAWLTIRELGKQPLLKIENAAVMKD